MQLEQTLHVLTYLLPSALTHYLIKSFIDIDHWHIDHKFRLVTLVKLLRSMQILELESRILS